MTVKKPTQEHLRRFAAHAQAHQRECVSYLLDPDIFLYCVTQVPSATVLDGDEVVAIMGLVPYVYGAANAWLIWCEKPGARHLAATRATRRILDALVRNPKYRELFIYMDRGQSKQYQWARLLGFKETRRNFFVCPLYTEMRKAL